MNSRTMIMAVAVGMALLPGASSHGHAQGVPIVVAQVDNPISSFFRQLFNPRQRRAPPQQADPPGRAPSAAPQPQRQRQARPQRQRQAPAAPAQPPAAEKDEDARQVVVFGDFFGGGLHRGLEEAFRDATSIAVSGQSNASSGLVRDDYFDWPAAMQSFLGAEEREIDVAVIMIGGNDRQPLRGGGAEHPPRSEEWRELYADRVDRVIDLFLEQQIPVYWVGLPPVQASGLNQSYATFNDIYRERSHRAGSTFIDVWNGFVDEDGTFTMHGPDINGEQRQLRTDDGLRFTSAGNRKLAHFVARDLRRDIGSDGELTVVLPQGPIGPQPFVPGEEEAESGVGQVVALTGAPSRTMGLAGGPEPSPEPPDDSAYYRAVILGEASERDSAPGRADDFSWPREEGDADAAGAD